MKASFVIDQFQLSCNIKDKTFLGLCTILIEPYAIYIISPALDNGDTCFERNKAGIVTPVIA